MPIPMRGLTGRRYPMARLLNTRSHGAAVLLASLAVAACSGDIPTASRRPVSEPRAAAVAAVSVNPYHLTQWSRTDNRASMAYQALRVRRVEQQALANAQRLEYKRYFDALTRTQRAQVIAAIAQCGITATVAAIMAGAPETSPLLGRLLSETQQNCVTQGLPPATVFGMYLSAFVRWDVSHYQLALMSSAITEFERGTGASSVGIRALIGKDGPVPKISLSGTCPADAKRVRPLPMTVYLQSGVTLQALSTSCVAAGTWSLSAARLAQASDYSAYALLTVANAVTVSRPLSANP